MSDTEINPLKPDENKLSAGNALATARRRQNLSLMDAAQHLKLGVKQLEALEADDYAKLPGRTFVRGFIRNYAKLLQIDPEPLLDTCPIEPPQQLRTVETSIGEIPSPHINNKIWIKYSIVTLVILTLVIGVGIFLMRHEYKPSKKPVAISSPRTPATSHVPIVIDKPQLSVTAPESIKAPLANEIPNSTKQQPISIEPIFLPSSIPAADNDQDESAATDNRGTLQFFFNEEAWVEITDASNKVIFYQLNPAGAKRIIKGQPPLQVVVGNAAHVTMTYNNKPINLTPYIKVEVARLTLK